MKRTVIVSEGSNCDAGMLFRLKRSKSSRKGNVAILKLLYGNSNFTIFCCFHKAINTNIAVCKQQYWEYERKFLYQLSHLTPLSYADEGDFVFKNHIFEIGGKNKTNKQVKHLHNSFVVADETEIGHDHKIPLWLFGFCIEKYQVNT